MSLLLGLLGPLPDLKSPDRAELRLLLFGGVVPQIDLSFLGVDAQHRARLAPVGAPIGEPRPGEVEPQGLSGLVNQVHLRSGVTLDVLEYLNPFVELQLGALFGDYVVEGAIRAPVRLGVAGPFLAAAIPVL